MDAIHNGSDVEDDSQATQLLQSILKPGGLSIKFDARDGDESNLQKSDIDPSPSERNTSNTLPHYHFHGLAATQTQTQHNDDDLEVHQSSQKENINADQGSGANSLSYSPQGSSSKNTPMPMGAPRNDALSRVTKPKSVKAVSFQSPRKTADLPDANAPTLPPPLARSTTYPITRTPTTRAGSEDSQDSFAGGQDPEQQFLAASKQFDVPLSELPRVVGGGTYESTTGASADSMYANFNPTRRIRRASTPPVGKILVEATPSLSGGSQSQPSQPFDDDSQQYVSHRQPDPMDVDTPADGSQYSDAPSSSYARHLEDHGDFEVQLPALEPTQPSTQVEGPSGLDVTDSTDPFANPAPVAGPSVAASSHVQASTAASTVPRSRGITSLIDPNKRWRYQQYLDRQADLPQAQGTNATTSTAGNTANVMEETQPSLDDELPPPRQFPGLSHLASPVPGAPLENTQPSFDNEMPKPSPRQFPNRPRPPNPVPIAPLEDTQPSFDEEMTRPSLRQFPNRPRPVNTIADAPMEDTQPSFNVETAEPSPRQFPTRFRANPSPSRRPNVGAGPSRQPRDDAMDIVPDSEPSREEETPSAPRTRGTTRSPAKKPPKRVARTSSPEIKVRDFVPDSMAVDQNEDNLTEQSEVEDVGKALLQDEPEDEEDIPLAKVVSKNEKKPVMGRSPDKGKGKAPVDVPAKGKQVAKGKQKAVEPEKRSANQRPAGAQMPSTAAAAAATPGARTTRAAATLPVKKRTGGRSWETGEVPSSLPEQDLAKPSGSARPALVKNLPVKEKRKAAAAGARTAKGKRNATAPTTRARRRQSLNDDEDEDGKSSESEDDELLMSAYKEDNADDDSTEPADDEYMDPNFQAAGPSRKRKRGASAAKPNRANTKVSSKNSKTADTPTIRQTKRLRSAASTSKAVNSDATRVFALWKQDGHYYPGTVHSLVSGLRYEVNFDDGTRGVVTIDQMRLCELRVGDDVLIPNFTRGTKVVDVSKAASNIVSVRVDDEIREVTVQAIKIASRTISSAWKDRFLSADFIVTIEKPVKVKASPTPSRLSMTSGSNRSSRASNLFGKTALVITMSAGGANWEKEREAVMSAIKNHGGTVIDDWTTLIRMEGKNSHSNNRWVIHKEDARWQGKEEIERVFLLADDASLKPKFLIALALGVPCLSMNWIQDSIEAGGEKDWLAYLLPQGYSDALGARPSQQIDSDWGNSIHQINEIMDNSVARKIFDGKSILCFGPEMVPQPKGKKLTGPEEKTQEAHNAVTRIILAMGAKSIEAVSDLRYASAPVDEFDFVVIKELHHYGSYLEGGTVVHWPWVKDCLIASRQLPLPEWDQPCSESQDA